MLAALAMTFWLTRSLFDSKIVWAAYFFLVLMLPRIRFGPLAKYSHHRVHRCMACRHADSLGGVLFCMQTCAAQTIFEIA